MKLTQAQHERGPGSQFHRDQTNNGFVLASRNALPDPMPGRDADGTPVWLHYRPIRWLRHP